MEVLKWTSVFVDDVRPWCLSAGLIKLSSDTCFAPDYWSFPIRIPVTQWNDVRFSLFKDVVCSILLLLWQLLLTKPAICQDITFIIDVNTLTFAGQFVHTKRIRVFSQEIEVKFVKIFLYILLTYNIRCYIFTDWLLICRHTVGPMFDASVEALSLAL